MIPSDRRLMQLRMFEHFDLNQNKQIGSANVACKDSEKYAKEHTEKPAKEQPAVPNIQPITEISTTIQNFSIKPGTNLIKLKWRAKNAGKYRLHRLEFQIESIKFKSVPISPFIGFPVVRQEPVIRLDKVSSNLTAGYEQNLELTLKNGSFVIEDVSLC